jgi:hypothetical protein
LGIFALIFTVSHKPQLVRSESLMAGVMTEQAVTMTFPIAISADHLRWIGTGTGCNGALAVDAFAVSPLPVG